MAGIRAAAILESGDDDIRAMRLVRCVRESGNRSDMGHMGKRELPELRRPVPCAYLSPVLQRDTASKRAERHTQGA